MRIDPDHYSRHGMYLLTLDAARGPVAGTPDFRRSSLALAPLLSHDHGKAPASRHVVRKPDPQTGPAGG